MTKNTNSEAFAHPLFMMPAQKKSNYQIMKEFREAEARKEQNKARKKRKAK